MLNFLDDLDAKINYMDRLCSQAEGEGYQWTPYQRTLERFLFVPGHKEETLTIKDVIKEPENMDDESTRQPSLWEL